VSVYTRIFFVFEYVVDGISRKLFTAVENTSFGKRFYYVFNVNALRVLVVNKSYDFGFFFVNYNFVFFYFIAVNDSSACKVAFLSCFVHSALYLLRKFGRVIFGVALNHTFEYNRLGAVGNIFGSGNDFNAVVFERFLVFRSFVFITRKPVEFVNKYDIEIVFFAIFNHLTEVGTIVVSTRHSTVYIGS